MTPPDALRPAATRVGLPRAFWAALIVLVLNDHLLKGAGLVPPVVTGKLSDFAGLIVAPLLLCALLRARSPAPRALAFASVALPFAALKIEPRFAHATAAFLTDCGMGSRIVCDPTDLLAFAVFPWSWRLAATIAAPGLRQKRWLRCVGLAAAALACAASYGDDFGPGLERLQPPFLINDTRVDVDVRVRLEPGDSACAAPADAGPSGIGFNHSYKLAPRDMVELTPLTQRADVGPYCGAASISVNGGSWQRVWWTAAVATPVSHEVDESETDIDIWSVSSSDDWAFERAITIVGKGGALELQLGPGFRTELQ